MASSIHMKVKLGNNVTFVRFEGQSNENSKQTDDYKSNVKCYVA